MPSALDLAFDKHLAALTAPGGPLETVEVERGGRSYPAFAKAPPSLAHYFAHYCAQHGDTCFLVDGDTRVSFAESFAIARRLAQALIARHGVERGDRIGLAARNSANWVLGYMAIVMAGGCATLLNGWGTGEDLAEGIARAVRMGKNGLYHLSGREIVSVFDFARRLAERFDLDPGLLVPTTTAKLHPDAPRPLRTGLLILKAETELGYRPRPLDDALDHFGQRLGLPVGAKT